MAALIAALAFVAGALFACFLPDEFHRWVRGAVGGTRGAARNAAPASTAQDEGLRPEQFGAVGSSGAIAPAARASLAGIGKAIGSLLAGGARGVAFVVRNPILCFGLALVAFWLIMASGCVRLPFGDLGKSRDTLRAELKEARVSAEVAEHEAGVARKANELAEHTHEDRERVAVVIARAEEEIEDAVSVVDFDALYRAYRAGYDGPDGVWRDIPTPDRSNPPAGGPAFMPSPDASPV